MLKTNTGFKNLKTWVDHMVSADRPDSILRRWHGRRWSAIEERLEQLSEAQAVNIFIDTYASSLAKSLQDLLVHGAAGECGEVAANYMEELLTQAEFHAEASTAAARAAHPQEDLGQPLLTNLQVPDDLAQAA